MPRTSDEQAVIDRFSRIYRVAQSEFMLEIERSVCGCDYGVTRWTTRQEAENVLGMLELRPRQRLLEIGAGAGWPGLYLAKRSGCDLALIDLPLDGLRVAKQRAASDQLNGSHWIALADASALPFRDGLFDAVYHSDVLCCLLRKLEVLQACRRVVRIDGKMLFSVIFIPPGSSTADCAQAKAGGHPFVEVEGSYQEILGLAGWNITVRVDLTSEFLESARRHLLGLEAHASDIVNAFGIEEAAAMLTRRRATVSVLEEGLLRRDLFSCVPHCGSLRLSNGSE